MNNSINYAVTLKFEEHAEQNSNFITRVIGLVKVKHLIPVIDQLDLDANPRDSKIGAVTHAIRESLEKTPEIFPFKSKGILLAASDYRRLERGRYNLNFVDPGLEGILDGGHNTLALGMYILEQAFGEEAQSKLKNVKIWEDFKNLWDESKQVVADYRTSIDETDKIFEVLIPVEVLIPIDPEDALAVIDFNRSLLDICSARNNNVQLKTEAKANAEGLFDNLKEKLPQTISDRVEWRPNDGGEIKVTDVIALSWVPLRKFLEKNTIKDEHGRVLEPVSPTQIYSSKGECMSRYERLMSSDDVTSDTPKRELRNPNALSAIELAGQMPDLYDLIYELFPDSYNKNDGRFGGISEVKKMNKAKLKQTKFSRKGIAWKYPDGYIVPLVAGLEALVEVSDKGRVSWKTDPFKFIRENIDEIVEKYKDVIDGFNYDPQKIGKAPLSYRSAHNAISLVYLGK